MQLPLNCTIDYIDDFLSDREADDLYRTLIDDYQLDKERTYIEAGDQWIETDGFKIMFSSDRLIQANSHPEHIHGKVYPWSGAMAALREKVEGHLKKKFELAMCLYYPNGNYFAPFHSDLQTSGHDTIIPSISLGEKRHFDFMEIDGSDQYSIELSSGSLLVMGKNCQNRYSHSLPKDPRYKNGRINITFREPGFQ